MQPLPQLQHEPRGAPPIPAVTRKLPAEPRRRPLRGRLCRLPRCAAPLPQELLAVASLALVSPPGSPLVMQPLPQLQHEPRGAPPIPAATRKLSAELRRRPLCGRLCRLPHCAAPLPQELPAVASLAPGADPTPAAFLSTALSLRQHAAAPGDASARQSLPGQQTLACLAGSRTPDAILPLLVAPAPAHIEVLRHRLLQRPLCLPVQH